MRDQKAISKKAGDSRQGAAQLRQTWPLLLDQAEYSRLQACSEDIASRSVLSSVGVVGCTSAHGLSIWYWRGTRLAAGIATLSRPLFGGLARPRHRLRIPSSAVARLQLASQTRFMTSEMQRQSFPRQRHRVSPASPKAMHELSLLPLTTMSTCTPLQPPLALCFPSQLRFAFF